MRNWLNRVAKAEDPAENIAAGWPAMGKVLRDLQICRLALESIANSKVDYPWIDRRKAQEALDKTCGDY